MRSPENIPVIVAVGEYVDRPASVENALEPLALMERAVLAANTDGGDNLLRQIDSIDLIGLVSWRYNDPASQLCERLGVQPARKINSSMGGETPIRLVHEAAVRIAQGTSSVSLIVGGEAMSSVNHARKERKTLNWTPIASKQTATRFAADSIAVSDISRKLGVTTPAQLYPLYEMAAQAAWEQTPEQAQVESAALWSRFSSVAARNPAAWLGKQRAEAEIRDISDENRLINWPYPKLMVANPNVNQAAAIIVTSLAIARSANIPEHHLIHLWGGAAAAEPEDYLRRDRYDRSSAQQATLEAALTLAGGESGQIDKLELYSCFPVVPKMALRHLRANAKQSPTVTGGLTFFGGPLNNYMSHAVCAMVRELRAHPAEVGLLYGQGGIFTKHHALLVSNRPAAVPLSLEYSVQDRADALRDSIPRLVETYSGPAKLETYTIQYGRDGAPIEGTVILRTPDGSRTLARVVPDDDRSLALLTSTTRNAIGSDGYVRVDPFGKPVWEAGPPRDRKSRPPRFSTVDREGPLTIVTINRPESLNSLHPAANAELAEIFDEFAHDPQQWVAIITAAGERAFSSGNDLKFMATAMARGATIEVPVTGFGGLTGRFDLNKPVIAAVNGAAMGGGFEIALACDLIIASDTAVFALPEPTVGLAALEGGLLRLPRQIGLKQAMGMILTGRRVGAEEALRLGFVNEVTRPEELLPTAKRWAQQIIECSPMSIRASKEIMAHGLNSSDLQTPYKEQFGLPATRALFRSNDFREGPMAFAQKRAPKWQGS